MLPEATVSSPSLTEISGIPIRLSESADGASDLILELVANCVDGADVHLCNTHTIALARQHETLASVLKRASLNLADGWPVALAQRAVTHSTRVRAAPGPDVFERCLEKTVGTSISHFFLGSTERTLEMLICNVRQRYPGLVVAGSHAPDFGDYSDDDVREFVDLAAAAQAQIVWVGLGTPKQDYIASKMGMVGNAVCIAVGAAFDFQAGTIRRAPRLICRLRLEWLYRLAREPRRLWRRYILSSVSFAAGAALGFRESRRLWSSQGADDGDRLNC